MTITNDDFLLAEQILFEEQEEERLNAAFARGYKYRAKIMLEVCDFLKNEDHYYRDAFWEGFYN